MPTAITAAMTGSKTSQQRGHLNVVEIVGRQVTMTSLDRTWDAISSKIPGICLAQW
jgi:hypothetical protein